MNVTELDTIATSIRRLALAAIHRARSGHPGGSLSCAELLAYLTCEAVDWSRFDPDDTGRDRIVLSKGHAVPALYAAAVEAGLLRLSDLGGFRKLSRSLQGHPHASATPWVETSTGSLGQGFSVAIGMALGNRHLGRESHIYTLLGDGELQEGEVWEGAMCAAHHHLDRLCAIVDYNKMQSDDLNANIMGIEPLANKWAAFGWHVQEIDGHDFTEIDRAISAYRHHRGSPSVIIAHTVKGKGVRFMEGSPLWHGSVALRDDQLEEALKDLGTPAEMIQAFVGGAAWQQ